MTQTFQNPIEFLQHLQTKLAGEQPIPPEVQTQLLHGSLHVINYLMESQNLLTEKLYLLLDALNGNQESWGHKISQIYQILDAADVTPEQVNEILIKEVTAYAMDKQ